MATQNRRATSGRSGGTSRRTTSSGAKNTGKKTQKGNQGPDLLTIVVVLIAVVLVLVLVSKYKKEKEGTVTPTPTGAVSLTETPENQGQSTTPEAPTPTPVVTKAPEQDPTPEAPTPTEEPGMSEAEAKQIVDRIIELEKYSIELLDDHLVIDGAEYYSFCVNDENGTGMAPLLIVEKETGRLYCYDLSGVVATIEKFPLDKTETGNEGAKLLTPEEAKKVLTGYSGERLGVAKNPSEYEMTVDDWTTMAAGTECYGINFFETVGGKQRFRGTFYVAMDGSAVYGKDDVTGDFVKR